MSSNSNLAEYDSGSLSVYLSELCSLDGVSGNEGSVRQYIIDRIQTLADAVNIDPLGNIIAFKKGEYVPKNKIMLSAHMDEVGLIITHIENDGFLRFAPVGGIDKRILPGTLVRLNGLHGVIGINPIHLCSGDKKSSSSDISSMYIDIGAKDDEQAKQYVSLGDTAAFDTEYELFGEMIKAKAVDDRVGCAILLDIISKPLKYDTWFAFTVQEEVGLRGSKTAAYTIAPDIAIVVESTTAADVDGNTGAKQICKAGGGPVVSFMDRATIYDRELFRTAFEIASEHDIPCQTKTGIAGGNDSGSIHLTRGGIRTLAISLPCRYIHSPCCMARVSDIIDSAKLISLCLTQFAQL